MNILSNMVSTFASAFDTSLNKTKNNSNLVVGENGSLAQLTITQSELDFDGLLCEYFLFMRGTSDLEINDIFVKFTNVLESNLLTKEKRKEFLIKLLKISLFIRNPRKGKGEKQVFYYIVEHLYYVDNDYRKIALKLLDLCSEFGYYKDYNNIYNQTLYPELKDYIIGLYKEQLIKDNKISLEEDYKNLSLCAKWAPREGSKYSNMAKVLANKLVSEINPNITNNKEIMKQYRQILSKLNKKLNTVQTFMCQKHWSDIDFKNVPSVSMTNLTKAFQDEKVSNKPKEERVVKNMYNRRNRHCKINLSKMSTDNRRHHEGDADYADREQCRQNLFNHIKDGGKINSSVTDLSLIIDKYIHDSSVDITWEAQWESRVNEIQQMISQLPEKPSIFPMVDLSSSMSGSPMINAITLGLFTSMILDNPLNQEEFGFANRFMSFASEPNLVKLPRFSILDPTKKSTLKEKVSIMIEWMQGGRWGGSTNIHKAIDLLLDIAVTNKLPPSSMPKILAIFSDMQFDEGDASWTKTSYDNISDKFKNAAYEVPHVLFWNLRSDAIGFQVKANTPNSSMLSGYSTRMLDLFLSADIETMKTELTNNQEDDNLNLNNIDKKTTLDLLNKALNHEMFEKYLDEFDKLF